MTESVGAVQVAAVFLAGLVCIALTVVLLRPVWLPIWRLFQGTQQFLEDWFGEPARPGQVARPGAMERLQSVETEVASVKKELHPNGGGSFRDDTVARISKLQHDVSNVRSGQELLLGQVDNATTTAAVAAQRAEDTARHVENVTERQRVESGEQLAQLRSDIAQDAERREAATEAKGLERLAEAYGLLAEVTANRTDGPIILPLPPGAIPPHAHELPQRSDPTLTGGPVDPHERRSDEP